MVRHRCYEATALLIDLFTKNFTAYADGCGEAVAQPTQLSCRMGVDYVHSYIPKDPSFTYTPEMVNSIHEQLVQFGLWGSDDTTERIDNTGNPIVHRHQRLAAELQEP